MKKQILIALAALVGLSACASEEAPPSSPVEYQYSASRQSVFCLGAESQVQAFRYEDESGAVTLEKREWAVCTWRCGTYCGLEPSLVMLWFIRGAEGWDLVYENVWPGCDDGGDGPLPEFTCGAT